MILVDNVHPTWYMLNKPCLKSGIPKTVADELIPIIESICMAGEKKLWMGSREGQSWNGIFHDQTWVLEGRVGFHIITQHCGPKWPRIFWSFCRPRLPIKQDKSQQKILPLLLCPMLVETGDDNSVFNTSHLCFFICDIARWLGAPKNKSSGVGTMVPALPCCHMILGSA